MNYKWGIYKELILWEREKILIKCQEQYEKFDDEEWEIFKGWANETGWVKGWRVGK
jgi:hypothetical protein